MSLFDRLFPGRGTAAEAKRAESRGDLARAIELWIEARAPEEAARLMILRGDTEIDPRLRLQHYAQAAMTATDGSALHKQARTKKASLRLALAEGAPVSATTRRDLLEAAKELEELGDAARAAEAYALLKDTEGQARALVQGGQVEALEALLATEQHKTDEERRLQQAHEEIAALVLSGRRREALATAERLATRRPLDLSSRKPLESLRARRLAGGVCHLLVCQRPLHLSLDEELVIGREGSLVVHSAALSRRHLSIARRGGAILVSDLGSRNGTLLRGMRISSTIPLGEGLELMLGGEVPVMITKADVGVEVQVAGETVLASFGPYPLGIESWRLERAIDGWVELVSDRRAPAYGGEIALAERTTLLLGDRVAKSRGGETVFEVLYDAPT
jgi:hypothetical protein